MDKLLTIGISETFEDKFKIIAIHNRQRFVSLDVSEFYDGKDFLWDNLACTEVEKLVEPLDSREICSVEGRAKIIGRLSKIELKNLFSKLKINWNRFKQSDRTYAVIKVDYVDDISYDYNKNKHRISFVCGGKEIKNLLNKDYRWIQYWNHYLDLGRYEEKSKYYKNYLNRLDKEVYVVMYRHRFMDGKTLDWIVGLHCL